MTHSFVLGDKGSCRIYKDGRRGLPAKQVTQQPCLVRAFGLCARLFAEQEPAAAPHSLTPSVTKSPDYHCGREL